MEDGWERGGRERVTIVDWKKFKEERWTERVVEGGWKK